jgi:hypothetical protein
MKLIQSPLAELAMVEQWLSAVYLAGVCGGLCVRNDKFLGREASAR